MFTYRTTVKLHQTDAAGVCFFGNYFHIAHDAYEAFMMSIGFNLRRLIDDDGDCPLIVHAESDYRQPSWAGDSLTVAVSLGKLGKSSYTLHYKIASTNGDIVAELTTVHAWVNIRSQKSSRLPESLVEGLKTIQA